MPPEPFPWFPPGMPPPAPPPVLPPPDDPPELDEPPPDAPPPEDAPPPDDPPDELDEPLEPPPLEDELPYPELPPGGIDAEGAEGVVGILADGQPAKSGRIAATAIRPFIALLFMLMPPSLQRLALPNAWVQIPT